MKMNIFEMERMQSTWENRVEFDMSESGIRAICLRELEEMGFDLKTVLNMPLGYSQSNGTLELRERLAALYPGAGMDGIEVTNGTSEANYLIALATLQAGDVAALEVPNYMQLMGIPPALGAEVRTFRLRFDLAWEPDWEEFERAVPHGTRLVYLSNPNNPTGAVLSLKAMRRIVERCDAVGAWLLADEVYIGSERERERTPSFWGMGEKVIVTSGLSKAYGIPGIRIGWLVAPPSLTADCWAQHDYLTIGPNKLSDILARTAVRSGNRERLYARTRNILRRNYPAMTEWLSGFEDIFEVNPHEAGAFRFIRLKRDFSDLELARRVLENQSTLIVPGRHLGMPGFLRVWMGASPHFQAEGLRRIGKEIRAIPELH
jgi:aspartate/methionine/tyrosine aminotransferase